MSEGRLVADPRADLDVAVTFDLDETEKAGLGQEFLDELRSTYDRIADGPLAYQVLRTGIRRALLRRFPYTVYFGIEGDVVVVLAALHEGVARDSRAPDALRRDQCAPRRADGRRRDGEAARARPSSPSAGRPWPSPPPRPPAPSSRCAP